MQKKSKLNVFTFMMLIILCLTFQPAISTYAACPEEISSYWKLDETSGSDFVDFIKDNDGTGNVNPATGIVNGAQEFNGTDTQINVPADRSFNWQTDDSFSIEFWTKIDNGVPDDNDVVVGRDDASTDLIWWTGITSGTGTATFVLKDTNGNGDAGVTGTSNLADGSWHHVVAVRDDSTNENIIYVDGDEQGRSTFDYGSGFDSATADLNIGWLNLGDGFYFDGLIDEVALYDRALTADEIEDHYDNGLAGQDYCLGSAPFVPFPDDTISLWDLDEATGPTYEDSFKDNDGTGNVNPATGIVNGAQEFNGTDTQINVPADRSFNWQTDDSFSIEFWTKIDNGVPDDNDVVVGRDDASTDLIWWTGITSGTGTATFVLKDTNGNGDAGVTGTSNLADGSWHHVVAVRDDSTNENIIYVDGDEQGRSTFDYGSGFDSATADLNIGWLNLGDGFYFDGLIDEVALYDRALTADEIEDHYEDGLEGIGIEDTVSTTIGDIAAGDFTGDGKEDVASVWPSGFWYQDGDTLAWKKISGDAPSKVTAGDVTGDGRDEIIGTWSNGIWYRDVAASNWTKMTSAVPDGDIAAGDFTGDGKEDVASVWPDGLWYQDGDTLAWKKISGDAPNKVTAGDVTGDGRDEIIGTWSSGIWYWDVVTSTWTQMATL